jgi:hypothetical protein
MGKNFIGCLRVDWSLQKGTKGNQGTFLSTFFSVRIQMIVLNCMHCMNSSIIAGE